MGQEMKDIDEYGKFTEEIWFSKHQLNCNIFAKGDHPAVFYKGCPGTCSCDQDSERSLMIMTMGLPGEVGEVLEILKKRIRDGKFDRENLKKELGDVAYYWARICRHFNFLPSEVLAANHEKLIDRKSRGMMRGSGDNR